MARLPQIIESDRLPVDIAVHPYLLDHCFQGKAVLPAVEAMRVLAQAVKGFVPGADITAMTEASFDKFLYIQPGTVQIPAFCDIAVFENGDATAVLQTKIKSGKTSITRRKEHVTLRIPGQRPDVPDFPLDLASALEGICMEISPDQIYRELVPFGPAYHNISETLYISEDGAIARIRAPANYGCAHGPGQLGSLFVLDAAFHAACAWGQRFARTVAFPVGIEKRVIHKRTQPGVTYFSRVLPVRTDPNLLIFDIWIYDDNGDLFESACGVHMRDVSAGRMKPPQWVLTKGERNTADWIKSRCRTLSIIELKTVTPYAAKTLSGHEQNRFQKMGDKRAQSYLAARLACKRLSRTLSGNDMHTAAPDITTVCADRVRPCCPHTDGPLPLSCSVSHDERFAVAVASDSPMGVDVEKMSTRLMKSRRLYMNKKEQALVQESQLGEIEAAVRIWSIKEAVAKALDISLADSWNRVQIRAVGHSESSFQIDDSDPCTGFHDTVGQHVITLVCRL